MSKIASELKLIEHRLGMEVYKLPLTPSVSPPHVKMVRAIIVFPDEPIYAYIYVAGMPGRAIVKSLLDGKMWSIRGDEQSHSVKNSFALSREEVYSEDFLKYFDRFKMDHQPPNSKLYSE